MSHRWNGSNSSTYDATSITVTLNFSSGTTVSSMVIDHPNVDVTANICSAPYLNCGDSYYIPEGGFGYFYKEFDSGYWETGSRVTVLTATDYMAGGSWIYASKSGSFQDMEIGGFVYASSLANKGDVGALSGMATFAGKVEGFGYGTEDGVWRTGDFVGNVTLTANFTSDGISGKLSSLIYDKEDENGNEVMTNLSDIDLTATIFLSSYATNGYVKSNGIESTDDDLTTSGSWAATFTGSQTSVNSTIDLSGIAGTYGFRLTDSDNASNWDNFFGAFLAGKSN